LKGKERKGEKIEEGKEKKREKKKVDTYVSCLKPAQMSLAPAVMVLVRPNRSPNHVLWKKKRRSALTYSAPLLPQRVDNTLKYSTSSP